MSGANSEVSPSLFRRFVVCLKRVMINGRLGQLLIIALVTAGVGILILDNRWSPESQRSVAQVVQELKSLPQPPQSAEVDFSSGFQPRVGKAERKIVSRLSEEELCAFYRPIMANSGWRLVRDNCDRWPGPYTLMEYQKGHVNWSLRAAIQNSSEVEHEYDLVSTWLR
jgi:hypothetical protein